MLSAVLVAQLHALQLGSAALPAGPQVAAYMPVAVRSAADPAATSAAANSPHQLDAALLGGGDLFARLQMGAAGPMLPVGAHGLMALQSAGMGAMAQQHAAAHLAAGAAMQQQQQQRQPPVPGRRRSTGGRRNEEKVRRTVYISDISEAVSEAQLAGFFVDCGQLVDCRVCGDPNSSMRFAFIEFMSEEAAQQVRPVAGRKSAGTTRVARQGLAGGRPAAYLHEVLRQGTAPLFLFGHLLLECTPSFCRLRLYVSLLPAACCAHPLPRLPAGPEQERRAAGRLPHPREPLQDRHCARQQQLPATQH